MCYTYVEIFFVACEFSLFFTCVYCQRRIVIRSQGGIPYLHMELPLVSLFLVVAMTIEPEEIVAPILKTVQKMS